MYSLWENFLIHAFVKFVVTIIYDKIRNLKLLIFLY